MFCWLGILIRMSEEVVEVYVGVEREVVDLAWCCPSHILLEYTMCSVVRLFCGLLPDATGQWLMGVDQAVEVFN